MRNRPTGPKLDLRCGHYRAVLMSPDRVSDNWVQWVGDPKIMLPLGVKPHTSDKRQLARYVVENHARQRAIIGIFGGSPEQHIGLVEVTFERKHLAAVIDVLIDSRKHDFQRVAKEVVPPLLSHLADRFKIEKFMALVPDCNTPALAYFAGSDWSFEAEFIEEAVSAALERRLNIKQYAWFPVVSP